MDIDVVVVGGGLGGMSLALALARRGVPVAVVEARPAGGGRDVFGFTLWPPGTRVLGWLDLLDATIEHGTRLERLVWASPEGPDLASVDLSALDVLGPFVGVLPSQVGRLVDDEAQRAGVIVERGVRDWTLDRCPGSRVALGLGAQRPGAGYHARIVVGADGPRSLVREWAGLPARMWRPPGQQVMTGIGSPAGRAESRQVMGRGWSTGAIDVGGGRSWRYGIFQDPLHRRRRPGKAGAPAAVADPPPPVAAVAAELDGPAVLQPSSIRARRWAVDNVVLLGDAAHGMLPHLGLGGSLTLGGVPVLADVIVRALAGGDTSALALSEFQARHGRRVAHARRACELFALGCSLPGFQAVSKVNLRRLGRHPQTLATFVRAMSGSDRPGLSTRCSVWLP